MASAADELFIFSSFASIFAPSLYIHSTALAIFAHVSELQVHARVAALSRRPAALLLCIDSACACIGGAINYQITWTSRAFACIQVACSEEELVRSGRILAPRFDDAPGDRAD